MCCASSMATAQRIGARSALRTQPTATTCRRCLRPCRACAERVKGRVLRSMLLHEQDCSRIMAEIPQCAMVQLALAAPSIGVWVGLQAAVLAQDQQDKITLYTVPV